MSEPEAEYFVGLDLGQQADYSAVAVIEQTKQRKKKDYAVRHLHRWVLKTPYPQIVEDLTKLLHRPPLRSAILCIDATGVGRAVVDLVKAADIDNRIIPITITGGSQTTWTGGEYHVPKKDLVGVMQVLFGSRRLQIAAALPHAQTLVKELNTFKVKVNAITGNESFECLVHDTAIATSEGFKPIQDIREGDMVLTRGTRQSKVNYHRVQWAGKTKDAAGITTVQFADGSIISGTPDHLVWTENRLWVEMQLLVKGDRVLSCGDEANYDPDVDVLPWTTVVHFVFRRFDPPVPVYDIVVEGCHEFFANGILVHNSWRERDHDDMVLATALPCWLAERGTKHTGTLYIVPIAYRDKKAKLRIVCCSREQLSGVVIKDEQSFLVSISDPLPGVNSQLPAHGLDKLLGSVIVHTVDIDPADYQDKWEENLLPYNEKPDKLVMTGEQGKRIWACLLRKRQQPPEVIVIQDDGDRRALSIAYAFCDVMRYPRTIIAEEGSDDEKHEGDAPNRHIYQVMKSSRGMVL